MRRKENYAMRRLAVPKRVNLPNNRTFYARYERIKRRDLPQNIQMERTYRQRAAPRNRRRAPRRQRGEGFKDTFKKLMKHPIIKKIARKGLNYAPKVYENITKRVKNKKIASILNSEIAKMGIKQAVSTGNRLLGPQEKRKKRRSTKKLPELPLD